MTYYPVVIPTLCRYEHFKRCVDSLARNTHASETELIIGLDYPSKELHWEGYRKIEAYISKISDFKKVTLLKREKNMGAVDNWFNLMDYAFERYDAVIASEDDNEFSPCFLDYMNKMLERYRDEPKVVSVCGFTGIYYHNKTKDSVVFTHNSGAWGLGQWKTQYLKNSSLPYDYYRDALHSFCKSWKLYHSYPGIYGMLRSMVKGQKLWGDVMGVTCNVINGDYQVMPSLSLVRNWGQDGSGLHSGNNNTLRKKYESMDINMNATFDFKECPIHEIPGNWKLSIRVGLPNNKWKAFCQFLRITLLFIKDRVVKV